GLIDVRERAVASAAVITGICRPGVRQRFHERRGIQPLGRQKRRSHAQAGRNEQQHYSPPQLRRGGCAVKKKLRSSSFPRRRGGVDQPPLIYGPAPPRPLPIRWLRDIFVEVASTPPRLRRGVAVSSAEMSHFRVTR